ncbi:DUF4346 domain-containing protein [Chloroflexota bacterium]
MKASETVWPVLPGGYFVVSDEATVAVSTLASDKLAETIAGSRPNGLCIIGKTETENVGIDKIIRNTVTNPAIRFLIVTGEDPEGHRSGATLLALARHGVGTNMRIAEAPGKRPMLVNTSLKEIEIFRRQIDLIDMIGCQDEVEIISKITELSARQMCPFVRDGLDVSFSVPEVIEVEAPAREVTLDKAGYFVIIPECDENDIIVEHYGYDNRLMNVIKGNTARDLYLAIVNNGWVSDLSHAAYLGKELEKAELSIRYGFKYTQDGA